MSIDPVISIAWDALKYVVVPIKRQFGYIMSSKSYAQDLQKEVGRLAYEAERVHNAVEEARDNHRNVYSQVVQWQANAGEALREARGLLDDFERATKTCCYGRLPEPNCRYQFSRKAKDKIEGIQQLIRDCSELKDISFIGPAPGNVTAPTAAGRESKDVAFASSASTSIKLKDDDIFKSRELIMHEIMAALADNNNSVVGIYGMGGAGKSTLLVDAERRIRKEKLFDWVIKADVSENQDIKRIQGEIARGLGLSGIKNEEYATGRADLLRERLEKLVGEKKKVLIILDNLWKGLDLKSVGIPCGHDNKVIGCKLLLTSRFQDVLRREMGCDRDFRLEELKDEEAKRLFERTVGDKVHDDPFKSLVNEAVNKCAGLPFLIIAMANIFKDADFYEWKDVLRQIEKSTNIGISESINKMLQLSYDRFKGEDGKEAKSLLRLCVVYGVSKPSLENLVRYGVGLSLFREDSTMEEIRNRLNTLIRKLKASSLLLADNEDVDGFKIHDLVRGFIASIASKDDPLLVLKDNDKSVIELLKDRLRSCTAVCFPYVDMKELPEELYCPEMRILLLFTNNESLKIPDSYFNSMRKLMVLHLSQVCLTHSPSPFQFLENLHTLCLDRCSLEDVSMIGELKRLHILSFKYSKIQRLPKEIGQLIELRLLDLNYCQQLKIIESGVLGNLKKLEELYMENSFDRWDAMEQTSPINAKLIELNNLKNLYTLHVSIRDPSELPEDLNIEKLTKYIIRIGDVTRWQHRKGSSILELKLDPISNILQKGSMQTFLGKTDDLFLDGLNGIEKSICVLSQKAFPNIKHLHVTNSPSVHYVMQSPSHTDFKTLESLILSNLINLEKICNNHISSNSFSALKVVQVESCNKMKVLFPLSLLRELPQLEEIRAIKCHLMQEIVEGDDCGKVELHNLRVLELRDLPNIKNFLTPRTAPSSSASKDQVGTQVAFFNGQQVSIPSLGSLKMAKLPNLENIWSDESPLGLSNLQFLEVSSCKSLLKVINSTSLVNLHKLRTLRVEACISVQEIFDLDGLSANANIETLSELKTIHIIGLPGLGCIWNKNPRGIVGLRSLKIVQVHDCNNLRFMFFPSMVQYLAQLRELRISDCKKMEVIIMEEEGLSIETSEILVFPMLTNLDFVHLKSLTCFSRRKCTSEARGEDCVKSCSTVLFNQEVVFPSLETLYINGMDNIEIIWDNQVAADSFHKLELLNVRSCNKLLNIVPSCILGQLRSLESLKVGSCYSLEVVFKLQPLNPLDGHLVARLPLKELDLDTLPKLKCVWDKDLHSQVKFQCLRSVVVFECKSLASLFLASVAIHLTQLEELEIRECGIVELIEKDDELVSRFVFPKLTSLELDLTELKCIYIGKHSSYWPALKTLRVYGCDKVEILASHLGDEMPLDKQPLFLMEKVAFPSLETLCIDGMHNIEILWDHQVATNSFHKLKSLEVRGCNKLLNIIPSYILGWPRSLESLEVGSCNSLEVVFKLQPLNPLDGHLIADLPLERLELDGLPKLKCVWDKALHSQVKFQCLRFVTVSRCKSLTSLFLASVAIHLTQLEELEISECGIVELIKKEGPVPKVVFPRLTSLKLKELIELKCIYTRIHALCWPALKNLEVQGCNKVEILASQLENEMPLHKQPLFLIEKGAFPNLQELKLDLSAWMEIWHGHFHDGEFFSKLRVLKLHHFSKECAISTCCFIQSLANLEKLVVCESYQEELSINIEAIAGPSHELEVTLPFSFQHLKTLEMSNCDKLSPYIILPFSRFFQRLKTLDMSFCDGLSNIFTLTIARNLVELTKLRISNCKMLTEVICDEEGDEGLVVAFNQLKYIELDGLTRLRCFSSIKYTLMFPLLEDVIVSGCVGMKFFSRGPIEAPKLERVQVSIGTWFWKENLNITIQNMTEKMEMVAMVKFIQLSEFPELIEKWHGELNPIKLSWQLKSLMVDKCPSFINAIPSKLMLLLVNMRMLQICDCESLEEIFDLEGLVDLESTRMIPSYMTLKLVNLPKLRRLWNKDLQGLLPYNFLYYINLYNCNNLRHAFNPSMAQCLASLSHVEIKECDRMEGVIEEEDGQQSTLEKITFPNLYRLKLECLPNLISFLSGKNQILECPVLIELTIAHCPKMSSLTGQSFLEIDHHSPSFFTPQVQFPQLKWMVLSHMDNLSKVWTDNPQYTLTFEHLQGVKVENCKNLEKLFPHWVVTSLTQLTNLQVESCGLEEIVASGGDTSHSSTAQFLFPQLTSLVFHDMPQLKSFCPNLPTLNWPFLEELQVTHCDKLNLLSFVVSMNKWAQKGDQNDLSDHEAAFSLERGIPTLKRLLLVDKDIQIIQNGKFSNDFFGKSKALTLACFHEENAVFPAIFLLQRFQNLQSLEILCSSFEDISLDERLVDEGKHLVLGNLKELKLSKLHNLKHVWREGYLVAKILQSISKFEVWDCPNLTTLFPVVTSFQNLTELVVKNSSGLVHLVTISSITNLVHLTNMTIIGCERMKEVVANDENGEGKGISLGKLRSLILQHLPSLECFSTTSCIFKFPSMYSIEVEECPKMKIFCKGMMSTPKIKRVTLFRYSWDLYWDGDLNTAIQKLTA